MSWKYFNKSKPGRERIYEILRSPVITEKATLGSEHNHRRVGRRHALLLSLAL